ncbi:hypothetical protein SHIRM173S_10499 [Streptomyces hirsutus]
MGPRVFAPRRLAGDRGAGRRCGGGRTGGRGGGVRGLSRSRGQGGHLVLGRRSTGRHGQRHLFIGQLIRQSGHSITALGVPVGNPPGGGADQQAPLRAPPIRTAGSKQGRQGTLRLPVSGSFDLAPPSVPPEAARDPSARSPPPSGSYAARPAVLVRPRGKHRMGRDLPAAGPVPAVFATSRSPGASRPGGREPPTSGRSACASRAAAGPPWRGAATRSRSSRASASSRRNRARRRRRSASVSSAPGGLVMPGTPDTPETSDARAVRATPAAPDAPRRPPGVSRTGDLSREFRSGIASSPQSVPPTFPRTGGLTPAKESADSGGLPCAGESGPVLPG